MNGRSPLGRGLYFIDVLACLLFCLSLVLVGARFGRELLVPVDLPQLAAGTALGSDLSAVAISVRSGGGRTQFFYADEPLELEELRARLAQSPPPAVVVRAEASAVARVIGAAHAAGVRDIQLAYERAAAGETPCCD